MKKFTILIALLVFGQLVNAQKYMTQNGVISFFSTTPVEDIEAVNNQVSAVLNVENGEIASVLLMKAFNFEKALMQEHFNEKFVESDKYPKSIFKGKISDFDASTLTEEPTAAKILGNLTIHGVTKEVEVYGMLSKSNSGINLSVEFTVEVADYEINIPGSVKDKIAKDLKVNADFNMNQI